MASATEELVIRRVIDKGDSVYTLSDIPKRLAEDAMAVQSAPNGIAIINSMFAAAKTLREKYPGKGGDWYNQHPIMALYLTQLCHLNHGLTPEHPKSSQVWALVEAAQTLGAD